MIGKAQDIGWLVRLRWGAALGQVVALVAVRFLLESDVPVVPLAAVFAVTIASNAWLASHAREASLDRYTGWVMALDILLLTALLYWTGGPSNPFSVLYLVHVTLSAVMLPPRWTWILAALSAAGFGYLFFHHVPLEAFGGHEHHMHMQEGESDTFSLHLQGMWFAYVCAAGLIAWLVVTVSEQLRRRESELAAARDLAARNEKLASLATLAAGAAHELGSPLATIAVAAGELERALAAQGASPDQVSDAALIRSQVKRCRQILDALGQEAGAPSGDAPVRISSEDFAERLKAEVTNPAIRWEVRPGSFIAPVRGLVQAAVNLVRNALDASPDGSGISVTVGPEGPDFIVVVRDQGSGMDPDTLAKAGEPFFTTKPEGKGLGLGVFLARSVAERLGGRLVIRSETGRGTTASLEIPSASVQTGAS